MKISKREANLAIYTIAALLFGGTWYVADSKMLEWQGMKDEMELTQNEIRKNTTAIEMQEEWIDDLRELQRNLRVFDKNDTAVASDLLKVIKNIAKKHDFLLTSTRPQNEKTIGELFETGINCQWEGTLESVVKFLGELQQQGVNYDVRSITMRPGRNPREKTKLSGSMMIHCAYTRKTQPAEQKNRP